MVQMAGDITRITMRCDSLAPVYVRRRIGELPDPGWVLGDAMLVASELVTNAVRHSLCSEDDELTVSVQRQGGYVRLSVRDPGVSGDMARISEDPRWFGGLGLRIVEQLSLRWGSQRAGGGHEVWAELPLVSSRDKPGAPAHSQPGLRHAHWRQGHARGLGAPRQTSFSAT